MNIVEKRYLKNAFLWGEKTFEEYGVFMPEVFYLHVCFWFIFVQNSSILEAKHWDYLKKKKKVILLASHFGYVWVQGL